MKVTLTLMVLIAALAGSANRAQAFPGGGWDGNNARLSVSHTRLLDAAPAAKPIDSKEAAANYPGGGWDANNARLSVSRTQLLSK